MDELSTEVLASVVYWLNGRDICLMWLSGSRLLNAKLSQPRVVLDFQVTLRNGPNLVWPRISSYFPTLARLSVIAKPHDISVVRGVDLSLIPPSVTHLELAFVNDGWALLHSPLEPDDPRLDESSPDMHLLEPFDLRKHLPNLRYLDYKHTESHFMPIARLLPFLPHNLVHLPLVHDRTREPLGPELFQALPRTLQSLNMDMGEETLQLDFARARVSSAQIPDGKSAEHCLVDMIDLFPPHLTRLRLWKLSFCPRLSSLASLTDLHLEFTSKDFVNDTKYFEDHPIPNLTALGFNTSRFDTTLATSLQQYPLLKTLNILEDPFVVPEASALLPRLLERWNLSNGNSTTNSAVTFLRGLPPKLETFPHLRRQCHESWLSSLPRSVKTVDLAPTISSASQLLQLPPELTTITTHYIRPSHVAYLPKTLTKVKIHNFTPPSEVLVALAGESFSILRVLSQLPQLVEIKTDDLKATQEDLAQLPATLRSLTVGLGFVPGRNEFLGTWSSWFQNLTVFDCKVDPRHLKEEDKKKEEVDPRNSALRSTSPGPPPPPVHCTVLPAFSAYDALPRGMHLFRMMGEVACATEGWESLPPRLSSLQLGSLSTPLTGTLLRQLPRSLVGLALYSAEESTFTTEDLLSLPWSLTTLILPHCAHSQTFPLPNTMFASSSTSSASSTPLIRPPFDVLIGMRRPAWAEELARAWRRKYHALWNEHEHE